MRNFEFRTHDASGLKRAAVAITVVNLERPPAIYDIPFQQGWESHAGIVLTRRAARLRRHAGQWALPGGRMDAGELPEQTALRELEEEVGLKLESSRILGRLDDFTTRSGFVIKPIVVWGGTNVILKPDPQEVASVHRIPLAEFMRSDAPVLKESDDSEHPILLMPVGTNWIAAPTAALLYQFREVAILGRSTRVDHFDQPRFARR